MDKKLKRQPGKKRSNSIAVIGDGSWATALFHTLCINGHEPFWWVRTPYIADYISKHHRNPEFLRALDLRPMPGKISHHLPFITEQAEILIVVIPSPYLRKVMGHLEPHHMRDKVVVSAIKGMIPRSHQLISDYFSKHFHVKPDDYVFLTGPSHAEEVAKENPTYITLASSSDASIRKVGHLLENEYISVRTSNDVQGLEYATVLKNIYAIAVGICHSLGYGDNFLAVLTANAAKEMESFLDMAAPAKRNLLSSPYLGDIMVTAFSQFSRNRTFGSMIGKGYSVKSALLELNMIPEGYFGVNAIFSVLKKYPAHMDIVRTVYRILYKKADPAEEISKLEKLFI
jgi:glycerol-3-phosphate dehydrogenase (NAD(P)+)